MAERALPTGWQERNDADHDAARYNPQPISRFEHESTKVGIRLSPAEPSTGTGSGTGPDGDSEGDGEYQVRVGADGAGDPGEMDGLADASDHADAFGIAREFMERYNERCVDGEGDLDDLLAEHEESERRA
jgi:hypothetical protein